MIELKKISKKYGPVEALNEVSFSIEHGKITALLGPNGAGKTTSMKILTGFLEPSGGVVEIDNEILTVKNRERLQQRIGYLPENAPLYPELNVWEHLDFSAKIHGVSESDRPQQISKTAKLCGLNEKLFSDISELSKGYKQRVGLAQAIIHDPDILILDEPTTGLDPNQILEIRQLISSWKDQKTILLSTHIMQEVEALADNVIVINEGQVIEEQEKSKLSLGETAAKINFVIEVAANKTKLAEIKKMVSSNEQVEKVESKQNLIFVHAHHDCRAEIARQIVAAKIDLLSLSLQKSSMEDIFRHLTQK